MRQSSRTIMGEQKNILAYGQHFLSVNIKATKANLTASLVDGILEAGTLIAANGNVATTVGAVGGETPTPATTDAFGVLLNDVDFNNSKGTEILPVVIHGFVKEADVKFSAAEVTGGEAVEKATLNMIKFL